MKFKTCIENAREELVKSLEFIKGVKVEDQTTVIGMTNTTLNSIDSLLDSLDTRGRKPGKSRITAKATIKKSVYTDDPTTRQLNEIWDNMSTTEPTEYKLMVLRMEPATVKGVKVAGYLETHHLPTTIPDIIEKTGERYGGGKFQIRIVDGFGKYVKSKTFEVSGLPRLPDKSNSTQILDGIYKDASSFDSQLQMEKAIAVQKAESKKSIDEDIDKNSGLYRS